MIRNGYGRIVNMASLAGMEGTPNLSAYSAAKAGVIALTKSLGKELALTNIRVNCVAPGPIETDLLNQLSKEDLAVMLAKSPMKRPGTVDELARIVLFLAAEDNTLNTGAVFDASAGRAVY
jgi:3-oxoacyl-[acyl-carrier protein] reductase